MLYACVRILNAPYAIDKSYSYHIPFQMQSVVKPGAVVVVPFGGGNNTKNAVVESISDTSSYEKTKPILGVPGSYLYVKPELLELCSFMSERLFCSVCVFHLSMVGVPGRTSSLIRSSLIIEITTPAGPMFF